MITGLWQQSVQQFHDEWRCVQGNAGVCLDVVMTIINPGHGMAQGAIGTGETVYQEASSGHPGEAAGTVATIVVVAVVTKKVAGLAGSARAGAAETAGEAPYLYRGLAADHPALGDAANGIARPRGGHSNPALHNGGNTMSEFTSWTTEESIARDIAAEANGPGTVLRIPNADGPGYVRVPSPDVYGESEVLIRGPVTGADVLPWEPR